VRRAALLLALLPGCGTTQLYDGPRLPPDQAVRLDEWHSIWDSRTARLLAVDGLEVDPVFLSTGYELAPGPHVLEAQASRPALPIIGLALLGDRCQLSFTAEPGVTYELRTETSDTHPPLNLQLFDTRTDTVVADNEPDGPEDCLSAEPDWDGREWTVAEFCTSRERSVAVFVPAGRTLEETDEWVKLQCHSRSEGVLDVDEVMDAFWSEWKAFADDPETTVLARGSGPEPGLEFILRGDIDDSMNCSLVVLRTAGDRVHALMWFKVTPDFEPSELAAWRERFRRARLFEPAAY